MNGPRALAFGLLLSVVCLPRVGHGQAAWEYTPYQARVWIVPSASPSLTPGLVENISRSLASRCESVAGAVLEIQAGAMPRGLIAEARLRLESLTAEMVASVATSDDLNADKIFVTLLTAESGWFECRLREFDCRTRQLSPVIKRSAPSATALPLPIWDALRECFTPLARIEQASDGKIVARLRAGGLAAEEKSLVLVEPGMVLRPVLRRNDRSGQPTKNGILPVQWTYFAVTERSGAVIEATQRSGFRLALPTRGGVRLERLALLVRPRHPETRLLLRSRTETTKPLVGYEVHRRTDNTEKTELLGVTDVRGAFDLQAGTGQLETLIVKNGKQLLARLPVVPGCNDTLTAHITDDDPRLEAEGLLAALSSRALDLVTRREVLAARIRSRLKDGKPEEAKPLLEEFRKLSSRGDLSRDLDRYRQQITSRDKTTQSRIDRLFADGQRILLLKPLSEDLFVQLSREVASAKSEAE